MRQSEEMLEMIGRLEGMTEEAVLAEAAELRSSSPLRNEVRNLNHFLNVDSTLFTSRAYGKRKMVLVSSEWPSELKARLAFLYHALELMYRRAESKSFLQEELERLKDEFLGGGKQELQSLDEIIESTSPVGRNEIAQLSFPPGHPQNGAVYVGHPLLPKLYYPFASFHRFLFEHKVSEAVRLLMSLGAKTMLVEHVNGWSTEFAGNLNLPIPTAGGNASLTASGKEASKSSMLFRATLRGTDLPSVPQDVLWYPHEAGWRQVAEGRVKYGLQEFSLTINYTEDFGVNGNLSAELAGFQLGVGGNFQEFQETTWKIEGAFA